MDLGFMIQMGQAYHEPLEPSLLTSEAEWRILKIEVRLEEELGEELDCVMCCCLEEGARHYDWYDIR